MVEAGYSKLSICFKHFLTLSNSEILVVDLTARFSWAAALKKGLWGQLEILRILVISLSVMSFLRICLISSRPEMFCPSEYINWISVWTGKWSLAIGLGSCLLIGPGLCEKAI